MGKQLKVKDFIVGVSFEGSDTNFQQELSADFKEYGHKCLAFEMGHRIKDKVREVATVSAISMPERAYPDPKRPYRPVIPYKHRFAASLVVLTLPEMEKLLTQHRREAVAAYRELTESDYEDQGAD